MDKVVAILKRGGGLERFWGSLNMCVRGFTNTGRGDTRGFHPLNKKRGGGGTVA